MREREHWERQGRGVCWHLCSLARQKHHAVFEHRQKQHGVGNHPYFCDFACILVQARSVIELFGKQIWKFAENSSNIDQVSVP